MRRSWFRKPQKTLCHHLLLKESEHVTEERPQGAEGGATDGPQPRGDVTWTHTEVLYSLGPSVPHVDSHTTTPHPPSPPHIRSQLAARDTLRPQKSHIWTPGAVPRAHTIQTDTMDTQEPLRGITQAKNNHKVVHKSRKKRPSENRLQRPKKRSRQTWPK